MESKSACGFEACLKNSPTGSSGLPPPTGVYHRFEVSFTILPEYRVNRPNLISKQVGTGTEILAPAPVGLQLCAPALAGSPTVQSLAFPVASHRNRAYLCLHGLPTCDHAVEHHGQALFG